MDFGHSSNDSHTVWLSSTRSIVFTLYQSHPLSKHPTENPRRNSDAGGRHGDFEERVAHQSARHLVLAQQLGHLKTSLFLEKSLFPGPSPNPKVRPRFVSKGGSGLKKVPARGPGPGSRPRPAPPAFVFRETPELPSLSKRRRRDHIEAPTPTRESRVVLDSYLRYVFPSGRVGR